MIINTTVAAYDEDLRTVVGWDDQGHGVVVDEDGRLTPATGRVTIETEDKIVQIMPAPGWFATNDGRTVPLVAWGLTASGTVVPLINGARGTASEIQSAEGLPVRHDSEV